MKSNQTVPYRALSIIVPCLAILACVLWRGANASPRPASSDAGRRIACVDRLKVVQTANLYFLAEPKQKLEDAKDKDLQALEAKIAVLEQIKSDLAKRKSTLKPPEDMRLSAEIQALDREIRKESQDIQRQYNTGLSKNLEIAYARIQKSVEAIGRIHNFDLIIDRAPEIILYCKPDSDVSDLVIAHLNAADALPPSTKPTP